MNTEADPGPLEQLRRATRSPLALTLGAALGGLVPASTYVVAHCGELVRVEGGTIAAASCEHPGWLLVLGGLLFSAKTVYTWTAAAFADRAKALGFVVLVEGALLLSPSPVLSYVALAYLVAINALGTGARLALLDRTDRAQVEAVPSREAEPIEIDAPEVDHSAVVLTAPAPLHAELAAPAQLPAPADLDAGLYSRAVEVARDMEALSGAALRRALGVRHSVAAALIAQLEANGVIASTKNALGQRPVLLSG
jgi:hypothetical protein